MQALVCGDILYSAALEKREACHYRSLLPEGSLHEWKDIRRWAKDVSVDPGYEKALGLVGTPMSLTSLNEGILDQLEHEALCAAVHRCQRCCCSSGRRHPAMKRQPRF